eukprot:gene3031-3789_t
MRQRVGVTSVALMGSGHLLPPNHLILYYSRRVILSATLLPPTIRGDACIHMIKRWYLLDGVFTYILLFLSHQTQRYKRLLSTPFYTLPSYLRGTYLMPFTISTLKGSVWSVVVCRSITKQSRFNGWCFRKWYKPYLKSIQPSFLLTYASQLIRLYHAVPRSGKNIKDVKDYVLANRSLGKWAILLCYLATAKGGGAVIGAAAKSFSEGIIDGVTLASSMTMYVLMGIYVLPKIAHFKDCLTLGDLAATFYGEKSKVITGILGCITTICRAGIELIMLGVFCEALLGIQANVCIVIGGVLLAIYSAYGGIRSVTATDIFHFLILLIVIPMLAYMVVNAAGGIEHILTTLPTEKIKIVGHKKSGHYLAWFIIWSLLPLNIPSNPATMQRFLMAKNGKDLMEQRMLAAAFNPVFRLTVMLIGVGGFILYPAIAAKNIVPHVIQHLLPSGIKGIAIIGLLAVMMSTINAYLHAVGFTIVHDVIKPLCDRKKWHFNELHWMRWATLLISFLAIAVGVLNKDIYRVVLIPLGFSGPLLMFPILSGIMGLKTDKASFYTAFVVTIIAFFLSEWLLPPDQHYFTILITTFANGITFFGVHVGRNKGFAFDHRDGRVVPSKQHKFSLVRLLRKMIPTPTNMMRYSQQKVKKYGASYVIFGVFLTLNYVVPYFLWTSVKVEHQNMMLILRLIGGVLCGLLIVQEKWPTTLLPYLPLFWHITVLFTLPFTHVIMYLLSGSSTEWLISFMAIIILLFILLDWGTALIVGVVGILLGIGFYQVAIGKIDLYLDFSSKYLLIYQGIFGILIGLIFARRKQQHFDQLAIDHQTLTHNEQEIKQAHLETFIEKIRLIKTLKNADIQKLSKAVKALQLLRSQSDSSVGALDKNLQAIESMVASVALALTRVDHRAMDYLRLEIQPITIDALFDQLQHQLPHITLHYMKKTRHHQVIGDPIQLIKLLKNTIVALSHKERGVQEDVYLVLEDTELNYPLTLMNPQGDYVKHVPAIRFFITQQASDVVELAKGYIAEMSSATLPHPTNGRELLLTENQRIVKAHYGYTNVEISKQAVYDYYCYVIPVDVNEIRPADMNDPAMELGSALVRANDQYPGAQAQEEAFLLALQQKSPRYIEKAKEALELIKWYHGTAKRTSGEPYYLHPLAVAQIVLDWNQEEATIIGALLHDIVEDTPVLLENIDMMFGPEVVRVVDDVTHFKSFKDSFYRGKLTGNEKMKMWLEVADKRALYVKVADYLHNMRTITGHITEEGKQRISQETLFFFVPLAKSLNLDQVAKELVERSVQVMNSVDFLIVYAFLSITLYIGLRAGRGVKDIRDYAIANKSFGTIALVLTFLAANVAGASVINMSATVFSEGIIMTVALFGVSICCIILALFIVPKAAKFDDCLTMGDLVKKFYGPISGVIAGGLGLLNALLLASMEFKVLGVMCESLLGIPTLWGILVGGICVATYTCYGGIRSVTITDIFQFIMLAVCIPLIAYVAIGKVGGIPTLLQQVPAQKLVVFSHPNFSFYLTLFLIWTIPAGIIDPALIQRLLMAKQGSQLRNQYLIAAAFDPVFQLVIAIIGLSAVVLYPHIESSQVVAQLIHNLLPIGLKGLCIAGMLAVGISSISSYLNAAGLSLAHDVIKPVYDWRKAPVNEIKWARYMTLLVSGVGMYIGLRAHDILGLCFSALEFVSPILFFPLVSGIMGLKTDKRSFYIALVATFIAFVLAKTFLSESCAHFSVLITMGTNAIFFFSMHLYSRGGDETIKLLLEGTDKRLLYVKVTLFFFVPLVKSLNLDQVAKELVECSVQVMNSVDYLIVYVFLAFSLWIGLRASRGIKDIRDYAIANKSFGTIALALSLLAANIAGASVVNGVARVFSEGIIMTVALLAVSISFIISGLFISPKIARFNDCLTMGDLVKKFYGPTSGVIAGGLGLLNAVLLVSMEFKVLGVMCESLLGIPTVWGVLVGGICVAIYTCYGGIRAVTITDIFQFIMLAVCIPLIAYVAINKIGGIPALLQQVPATRLVVFSHPNFSFYLTLFLIWVIPAGMIDPALIQRWLMAKRGSQLRYMDFIAASFDPVFRLVIMFIGLSAIVLYPEIEKKQVLSHLIYQLLPVGVKGLCIAGVLAVGISSISSYLNAAGLTLAHDVIKPVYDWRKAPVNEIKWARYMTLLVSGVGMYIGLRAHDILGLCFSALEFVSPILFFPLVGGIMGLTAEKRSFYAALIATLIAFLLAKLFLNESNDHFSVLITMGTNAIVFFAMHLYLNKGLAIRNKQGQEKVLKLYKKDVGNAFKFIIPTPRRMMAYSQRQVAVYGAPYVLFGTFLLINYTLPYFIWTPTLQQYANLMLYLRLIGGILCVLLLVKDKWAPRLLPYFPSFWHFMVMYCLPFTSTIMLLVTSASIEWIVNIFVIIILLFVLLDWLTAAIVGLLGIGLGFGFYKLVIGAFSISLTFTDKYLMIYQGVFGLLIGLLFARRKQQQFDQLATDHQILTNNEQEIKQAHLETFIEKIRLIKTLKNADIQKLSKAVKELKVLRSQVGSSVGSLDKTLQDIESMIASVALALTRVDHRAMDYLRLEIQPITIDALFDQLQLQLPHTTLHCIKKTRHQQIIGDPIQLVRMFKNTVVALFNKEVAVQEDAYLILEDTGLTYPLSLMSPQGDYVKHIPAIRFVITQQPSEVAELAKGYIAEMSSATLPYPTDGRELLLTENQRIVKAHYGYTNVEISKQAAHAYYLYVIPVDVNEIRPADMNDPMMELGSALVRANDQYPGAQEQEKAFLLALQEKAPSHIEKVKEALELIKWYHGSAKRRSGEPYYLHPLSVAQIVLDWNQEEATIIGALLHDTVEDTPMLLENIDMMFGPEVVRVVDYVTHFKVFKDSFYRGKLTDDENMKMLLEATDKRALYVKVADRLHNMRTIEGHKTEEKKNRISKETLSFFVPLAKSLNLDQTAQELLARSTQILNR